MEGPGHPPPPTPPPRPDERAAPSAAPAPSRRRAIAIGVVAGLAIAVAAVTVVLATSLDDDGFPDQLDGLDRIRSGPAEDFEESLEAVDLGSVSLTGAMYGRGGEPLVIVERIDAGELGTPPLRPTFDGVVAGFESSGAGEIEEDAALETTRGAFEVVCATVDAVPNPMFPSGQGTVCSWRGVVIGVVFDFRSSDLQSAVDTTVRIAEAVEAG